MNLIDDCPMCSGEYCAVHYAAPCDCDTAERHDGFDCLWLDVEQRHDYYDSPQECPVTEDATFEYDLGGES